MKMLKKKNEPTKKYCIVCGKQTINEHFCSVKCYRKFRAGPRVKQRVLEYRKQIFHINLLEKLLKRMQKMNRTAAQMMAEDHLRKTIWNLQTEKLNVIETSIKEYRKQAKKFQKEA